MNAFSFRFSFSNFSVIQDLMTFKQLLNFSDAAFVLLFESTTFIWVLPSINHFSGQATIVDNDCLQIDSLNSVDSGSAFSLKKAIYSNSSIVYNSVQLLSIGNYLKNYYMYLKVISKIKEFKMQKKGRRKSGKGEKNKSWKIKGS